MDNIKLNVDIIKKIYFTAFQKTIDHLEIKKLSGGMKNEVYSLDDGEARYVLKVEPNDATKVASIDQNTLWWEARILKELEPLNVHTPKMLYYSDGIEEFHYPFLITDYINGVNYNECKKNLSVEQRNAISYDLGKINKKISSIKKDEYFLPAFPDMKFNSNYEFISFIFNEIVKLYKKFNIDIDGITGDQIIELLAKRKNELNAVSNVCMCATDLWDGNVLVNDGKLAGIVDFADVFYCDELMAFYFHLVDNDVDNEFLKGYDEKKLNDSEKVRVEIYRMYVLLKMIVDCEIKHYGKFAEMYNKFAKVYKRVNY